MEFVDIYPFLISMLIGALVGTERQRRLIEDGGLGVAGLRTFILISLLGTLSSSLTEHYGPYFIVVAFGCFMILVGIGYATASRLLGWLDFTSAVAACVTYILGVLCYYDILLSAALSILVTLTLASRKITHRYVEMISDTELLDTLKMGIIALVVLPLLPDETIDPFYVLNPRRIWMMVVLVSLISYAGYVLIRILGEEKGLSLTGFLGGLVSSTAVTMTMATEVRERRESISPAVFATIIASCTMFPRILLIIVLVNRELLMPILPQMIAMMISGIALAYIICRRTEAVEGKVDHKVEHTDPFKLFPALKFGALFAMILLMSKLASIYFGDAGIYAASVISGLADIDAITLSMATLASSSIGPDKAAISITIAAIVNTLVKLALTFIMGSVEFGRRIAAVFLPMIIIGLIVMLFL